MIPLKHGSPVLLAVSVAIAVATLSLSWPTLAKKPLKNEPLPPLPLSIAVAQEDGRAVRDDAWIDAQIAESSRLFNACGVQFRKAKVRPLPLHLGQPLTRLETRKDRDALASSLEKGQINVMVVASLRDVDDPSLFRMGVHWRPQTNLKKHYIIVAATAQPSTLAHELGHYFGLGHTKVMNNLMSYERDGSAVFLDAKQEQKIRAFARIYVSSQELTP